MTAGEKGGKWGWRKHGGMDKGGLNGDMNDVHTHMHTHTHTHMHTHTRARPHVHAPPSQQNILDSLAALQQADSVSDIPPIGSLYWLHNMLSATTGSENQTVPEAEFYPAFAAWLGSSGVTSLADLSCIDSTTGEGVSCYDIVGAFDTPPAAGSNPNVVLQAVRGSFYQQNLDANADFVASIRETREQLDGVVDTHDNANDKDLTTFAIGYVYFFWEQYLTVEETLYTVVGLCLVGVFAATLLLQFNLAASAIVCGVVLMSTVEVYGLLPIWSVQKNAFSLVNLCLSVGMGIEFTAHITHQFLAERGDSRVERARNALAFMGTAMFHGAVSSIITTLFIAGSNTAFIREYFFGMFFATVVVCSLNGMLFLPVVLSLVGPAPIAVEKELDDADDGDNGDDVNSSDKEADVAAEEEGEAHRVAACDKGAGNSNNSSDDNNASSFGFGIDKNTNTEAAGDKDMEMQPGEKQSQEDEGNAGATAVNPMVEETALGTASEEEAQPEPEQAAETDEAHVIKI